MLLRVRGPIVFGHVAQRCILAAMSKKEFRHALDLSRAGALSEALGVISKLERGFVRKRLEHFKRQPDEREAALQLESALAAAAAPTSGAVIATAPPGVPDISANFVAPLSPPYAPAPGGGIGFDAPEPFLSWVSGSWDRIPRLDLAALPFIDIWAVVGLGALALGERERQPPLDVGQGGAAAFARAVGLTAVAGGQLASFDQPLRSVRLTRIRTREEIEPMAERMASLVIPDPAADAVRLAIRYVLVELLRNVVQHSGDSFGAVAAAQRMEREQRRNRPMVQVAVADAGIGIPRHLQRAHPHLVDYRQALERALLPHVSGTFAEGLSGSFENAGLGLFMITELARRTGGRLLIATRGASLVVQRPQAGGPAHPRFIEPPGVGYPGTLVSFEIPTQLDEDYFSLMQSILRDARERTPKRASARWLAFESATGDVERIVLHEARENTLAAGEFAAQRIRPALLAGRPVELDFVGLELCTQSWLHALLFEPIRLAWALRIPIHVVNAVPAVREGLRYLEAYGLGG